MIDPTGERIHFLLEITLTRKLVLLAKAWSGRM